MSTLDNILSGSGEAVPETNEKVEATNAVEASQSNEAAIQEVETPEAEQSESASDGQKQVPLAALHAEKQKVKRYTEQVASFEQTLKERETAWERRFEKLLETVKQPQPQQQEQQKGFYDYENPDEAVDSRLSKQINPIAQTVSQIQSQLFNLHAVQTYGAEKVGAFKDYVREQLGKGDPEIQALDALMSSSPDPMKVGLEWFEKRTFDPEKERERIREELLAEIQPSGQQQAQQRPAPTLPTSLAGARNAGVRSGPAWSGPSPIADIFNRQRGTS